MHKLNMYDKKVEIYSKVIVLLFIKKKKFTIRHCPAVFPKHSSLQNDQNLAYYYHYYYYFIIILIILILCLSLKPYCFPLPIPSFFVVLDIYIKPGFPMTNEFQF